MTVQKTIIQKLTDAYAPTQLDVIDESEKHRGHAGFREGGETHFHVVIASAALMDMSRVARQRAVYKTLDAELAGPVHALSIEFK